MTVVLRKAESSVSVTELLNKTNFGEAHVCTKSVMRKSQHFSRTKKEAKVKMT